MPNEVLPLADCAAVKYEIVENTVDTAQNEESIWLRVQEDGLPEEVDFT